MYLIFLLLIRLRAPFKTCSSCPSVSIFKRSIFSILFLEQKQSKVIVSTFSLPIKDVFKLPPINRDLILYHLEVELIFEKVLVEDFLFILRYLVDRFSLTARLKQIILLSSFYQSFVFQLLKGFFIFILHYLLSFHPINEFRNASFEIIFWSKS